MANETVTDVAILGELDRRFAEAAAIVPAADVVELEAKVAALRIEDDTDNQSAVDLGVTVATMVSKVEGFWEGWREHYFRRYKSIMTITKDGISTADAEGNPVHQITGTAKLAEIRKRIEFLMRDYKIRRDRQGVARQESLDRMVTASKADITSQVKALMLDGDVAGARKLQREAEGIHPVAIMRQEVKLDGADMRQPWKWSLEADITTEEALMKVIRAVASGEVPLMHDISVKGKPERRALIDLSAVVLNCKTREMGPDLRIPGIAIEQDVSFAFSKKAG